VQLECTPACQAGGRGFKSRRDRQNFLGRVAQLAEHTPEKRGVTGSTPVSTTLRKPIKHGSSERIRPDCESSHDARSRENPADGSSGRRIPLESRRDTDLGCGRLCVLKRRTASLGPHGERSRRAAPRRRQGGPAGVCRRGPMSWPQRSAQASLGEPSRRRRPQWPARHMCAAGRETEGP
jgi:hypothetical protein